jgi:cytidylate kinase
MMFEHSAAIKPYLDSMCFESEHGKQPGGAGARYPFITISRQVEAGGHSLADALLAEMKKRPKELLFQGWQLFDRQLCQVVADDPKLKVTLNSLVEERMASPIEDLLKESLLGQTPQKVVHRKIFEIIRSVACLGKAIILGRGASCLTRNMPGGVHVRLVAPLEVRIKRLMKLREIDSEAEAREQLEELDESRRKLVRVYFDRDIDDPLLYDVVFNTDSVPLEEVARAVLGLVQFKARD